MTSGGTCKGRGERGRARGKRIPAHSWIKALCHVVLSLAGKGKQVGPRQLNPTRKWFKAETASSSRLSGFLKVGDALCRAERGPLVLLIGSSPRGRWAWAFLGGGALSLESLVASDLSWGLEGLTF